MLRQEQQEVKVSQSSGVLHSALRQRVLQILHGLYRMQTVLDRELRAQRAAVVLDRHRDEPPVVVDFRHVFAHAVGDDDFFRHARQPAVLARLVVEPPVGVQPDALIADLKRLERYLRSLVLVLEHHDHGGHERRLPVLLLGAIRRRRRRRRGRRRRLPLRHLSHLERAQGKLPRLRRRDVKHAADFLHPERARERVRARVLLGSLRDYKRVLRSLLLRLVYRVHEYLAGVVHGAVHPPEPHLVEP
eukprot:29281-Pelagococcus_subviridis.AAC.12